MSEKSQDYIIIGKVLKPQGLKGEIKVHLLTDYPERFAAGKLVNLKKKH
jgi:ribosomal 30S subunit maturation factor RimM